MSLLEISIADLNGVFLNPYACVRRLNEIIVAHVSRLNYEFALQPASFTVDISIDTWKDGVSGIKYSLHRERRSVVIRVF